MNLSFIQVTIENFGSFLGQHKLDLATLGVGLHFVRGRNEAEPRLGPNGVGKSTLFHALCWCLTGKTPDGRRNPDIQPRFGDKHTTVVVGFQSDGAHRTITRSTYPNRLLLDGKEVGQEQIDTALGLDFDVFTNTVLLGQGRPLFFDLEPKRKMELFSTVLGLDRWDARAAHAGQQTIKLEQLQAELTGESSRLSDQVAELDTLLTETKARWASWRDDQTRAAQTLTDELKRIKVRRTTLSKEKDTADLAYDSAATELSAAQKHSRVLSDAAVELVQDRSKLSTVLGICKAKTQELKAELGTLGEAETCPTCGQSIKGTDLSHHKAEFRKDLAAVNKKYVSTKELHDAMTANHEKLATRLRISRQAEANFQTKTEENRDALDRLTTEFAKLESSAVQMARALKERNEATNPYADQIKDFRHKRETVLSEGKELEVRLQRLGEQIERTRFWSKGFKEVRLYIIEDVLQELELTTNATLADVGLIDWSVAYSTERETKAGTIQYGLNVFIKSPKDKVPVKWECWSGGEQQRLRLIGALALSEVLLTRAGVIPNIEILDEPTQHLSAEGVKDLCEFLALRAQQLGRMVLYVDHTSIESAQFTSVLTVVKNDQGSMLSL